MSLNKSFSTETSERYSRALFEVIQEANELEKVENNGVWDDNTIIFDSAFQGIPHFAPISVSQYGKLSILGALVDEPSLCYNDECILQFDVIDSKIATIHLKIKHFCSSSSPSR